MKNNIVVTSIFLTGMLIWASCQSGKDAAITLNAKGEMTAFGRPVADFESLKTALVDSLSNLAVIPEKLEIRFEGEVGMGARQEVETIAQEAVEAAKLLRKAPKIQILSFRKQHGTDCDQPDSLRTFCANIDLQYPAVEKGEKAVQDSVNAWSLHFLSDLLAGGPEGGAPIKSLDEAAAVFFKNHDELKGSVVGGAFEARTGGEAMLNDGKYLTLAISGYTYQGGAHGNMLQAIRTFDAQTGKTIGWDDLVTDKAALQTLAEKKVREVKADVFKEGFDFDETFRFTLPAAYGLTKEGLFLFYVPYEIMPYAMGETEVLIPFTELETISKIKR